MKTSDKLQKWVEKDLITKEQAQKILLFENSRNSNIVWKWMYGIAGLFIGLGIILIIGANWNAIPPSFKLVGDFTLWGVVLYQTYLSLINKKDKIKELFLILSFLFVGATIGMIGQIFNLSGGWHSFALAWSVLGLPFVLYSRLLSFNFCWLCLFFSLFNLGWLEFFLDYINTHIDGIMMSVILLSLLSYAGKKLDEEIHHLTLLPRAFQNLAKIMSYAIIFLGSFVRQTWFFLYFSDVSSLFVYIFAFAFFAVQMLIAVKMQNMISFKRNAIAVEIYIFLIFANRFGNLLLSGFGFLLGGLAVLGLVYALKKTSKYIKKMEVFHA